MKYIKKLSSISSNFYEAWKKYVSNYKSILLAIIIGGIVQLAGIIQEYGIGIALNINIPFCEYFWIYATLSLLLLIPISFAGFGVREISLVGLLSIYEVSKEYAITISFIMASAQLMVALIGGIIVFLRQVKCGLLN